MCSGAGYPGHRFYFKLTLGSHSSLDAFWKPRSSTCFTATWNRCKLEYKRTGNLHQTAKRVLGGFPPRTRRTFVEGDQRTSRASQNTPVLLGARAESRTPAKQSQTTANPSQTAAKSSPTAAKPPQTTRQPHPNHQPNQTTAKPQPNHLQRNHQTTRPT